MTNVTQADREAVKAMTRDWLEKDGRADYGPVELIEMATDLSLKLAAELREAKEDHAETVKLLACIEDKRDALRAENAELRRAVVELRNGLLAHKWGYKSRLNECWEEDDEALFEATAHLVTAAEQDRK